jgi:hypothetical protein
MTGLKGWFLGFHVFTRDVKGTFFRGTSLRPFPPEARGGDAQRAFFRPFRTGGATVPGGRP